MSLHDLSLQLASFDNAISSLESCFEQTERTDLERDGIIQRFEYTFEYSRKTLQKFFQYFQIPYEPYPKAILKTAHQLGWIQDIEIFFDFLGTRNQASHVYDEDTIEESFEEIIIPHYTHFRTLYNFLVTKQENETQISNKN